MTAFLKYSAISVSVFLIALGLRYIPYIAPVRDFLPLSPENFDRLGEPPTKNFDDNQVGGVPGESAGGVGLSVLGYPSSDEESALDAKGKPFSTRFFERLDLAGLSDSPVKDFEVVKGGEVKPLPTPKPALPAPAPSAPVYVGLPTPNQVVQVVERIVERVIIKEVEKPVPATQPAPTVKPAPAPSTSSETFATTCSIHTFENSAGGTSHTLIYQCEGYDQCSIAKSGENFVDVSGKGYFNFAGAPPSNYKLRCDEKARAWSSAITPFATKPLLTQLAFRWFYNDDIEVGMEPLAAINQAVSYKSLKHTRQLRLRLAVLSERAAAPKGDVKLKLQGAVVKPSVAVSFSLLNYGALCNQIPDSQFHDMDDFESVEFFNNPSLSDKSLLAPSIEDPFYGLAIPQTYQESALISNTNAAIPVNTPAIWDLSLRVTDMSSNEMICLRLLRQDNVLMDGYESWPVIYN